MNRALLLIAGWIGRALALKVSSLKRPLAAEVAVLHERLEQLTPENELLRARLERLDTLRRPSVTQVPLGFFRTVVVGAVLDLFSRKIMALDVAPREPDAAFACQLLSRAIRHHGKKPRWVVSDHGVQFTSSRFLRLLARRKIRRLYGAVGKPGAPALDRWFRTIKEEFARGLLPFRSLSGIARDLSKYVACYNRERPHLGLRYRTPEEVFLERPPRRHRRIESGRLEVTLLNGDRRLCQSRWSFETNGTY